MGVILNLFEALLRGDNYEQSPRSSGEVLKTKVSVGNSNHLPAWTSLPDEFPGSSLQQKIDEFLCTKLGRTSFGGLEVQER
ncbi:hypothetical protein MJO28_016688 [Puccinia striiformis f. sp. tritici]|uniref:Uncharacterized protein n=1 Tax=Puccinia striiformis f. sp. tritici TaxID=168172 RepID=A0ACC0DNU7_9BASI|nr:hypothetical protein MJO28_016688 [Puccinia striiformis f. sp. tritici]